MPTEQGCLLFHGFTGSPEEVSPLAEHLQKRTDWLIHVPTLPGHGANEDLRSVTWQDWLHFAEQEFKRMQEDAQSIYVVGFSMGGLIACHLAAQYPVERLVLLSPALFYPNPPQLFEDIRQLVKDYSEVENPLLEQLHRYKKKIIKTPWRAVYQFKKLVNAVSPEITQIHTPILIIQGEKDGVVIPNSANYIYEHVQSEEKGLLFLPQSKHMLCHDCEQEIVLQEVERFLNWRN